MKIMKVKVEFDTDNAAFEDDFIVEISKVLNQIRNVVHFENNEDKGVYTTSHWIGDSNGNKIGKIEVFR